MDRYRALASWLLLAFVAGCGGGGASESGSASNFAGSFTPDAQNPGANTVYMTGTPGSGSNANLVTVHVFVSNTSDVYGASFDLEFDPNMAQFVNWTAGQVLEFGGQSVSYQINASTPGRVVVGVARTSGGVGVTVPDEKPLIHLTLRVTDAGSTAVGFTSPALLNSQNPPQPKTGVTFFGGTLTGV
jgi:Cohesin domain